MSRARDPKRDEAIRLYLEHDGNITNREIARLLDIDEKIVAVWKGKSRDNWSEKLRLHRGEPESPDNVVQQPDTNVVQQGKGKGKSKGEKSQNSAVNKKTQRDENGKFIKGNNVALGNRGNPSPSAGFSRHNTAAVRHGLYRKYLPADMLEIVMDVEEMDILDQLYMQIQIALSSMLKAQQLMNVESSDDHLTEVQEESFMEAGTKTGYKVMYSYERYRAYVAAQNTAFSSYRALVKQFLELADESDARRLKLQHQELSIKKIKKEISAMKKEEKGADININIVDEWRESEYVEDLEQKETEE